MHGWSGRHGVLLAALLLAAAPVVAQSTDTRSSEQTYTKAMHLFHTGAYEQALPLFVSEVDVARSRFGLASGEHATALNNLGEVYRQLGELEKAEEQFVQALAIEEARRGTNDPWLAKPLNNLALVHRAQGRYQEAERNLKRSLEILEESLGHRHPDVAGSLNNLARLYETMDYPERAEPLLQRALMIARNTLGDAHPTTQHIQANLDRLHTTSVATAATDADGTNEPALPNGSPPPVILPPPMARPGAVAAADPTASEDTRSMPRPAEIVLAEAVADKVPETEPAATEVALTETALPLPKPLPEPSAAPMDVAVASPIDDLLAADVPVGEPASPDAAGPDIAAASPVEDLPEVDAGTTTELPVPAARPAGLRWPRLPDGRFAIHLASVRSPISATEEWLRLREQFELDPDLDQLEPERIEVAQEGVFYRVMAGPFATRDAAAAACGPLRRKDVYCGVLGQSDR